MPTFVGAFSCGPCMMIDDTTCSGRQANDRASSRKEPSGFGGSVLRVCRRLFRHPVGTLAGLALGGLDRDSRALE
jgi:hypothetical protein